MLAQIGEAAKQTTLYHASSQGRNAGVPLSCVAATTLCRCRAKFFTFVSEDKIMQLTYSF